MDPNMKTPSPPQSGGKVEVYTPDAQERTTTWLGLFVPSPPLTLRQRRVFWIASSASFFNQYDSALLALALKQIQRGLAIADESLGATISFIRFGYLLPILITPFADVFGRRRLLLYTLVGYTVFTGLTALAPDRRWFVVFQVGARALAGAESIVAIVIVIEEVDAAYRGWSIGLMGALASCGYGVAGLVFALVNVIPYGWRALYAVALIPLALILPLRRLLPESRRFEREHENRQRSSLSKPMIALLRSHPARLVQLLALMFTLAMGGAAASLYFSKFFQEAHGFSAGNISSLYVFGCGAAILGSVSSGRLSDWFGRRRIGALVQLLATVSAILVYLLPGLWVIPAWIGGLFFDAASSTILGAYSAELFPTSYRSTAGSAQAVSSTVGAAVGLIAEGALFRAFGSHWRAVRYLLLVQFVAPILVYSMFPETAGRELEDISPDA
jgi:putative MFS transporter